ncbi:MAG: tRNA 2-thiouridine(34) synthase MnmA [Thermoleophilaceae bacterium]|nr:tRNA 2-thiouridine(34) synthase MnmA [Thermoleophilaceae bacterium]
MPLAPIQDHLSAPRGLGALAGAPHSGAAGGAVCGDIIRIAVRVEDGVVAEAGFDASGCAAARAAGSAVVELVEGAGALSAASIGPVQVAGALGGLAPSHSHAADLAVDALHRALGAAARDGAIHLAPRPGRTLVAMSGGVDSAVAALLAARAGEDVLAVTLELWADPATDGEKSCCSPQAVTGARALAHRMGIPHLTLDLREDFEREVVDPFVTGYSGGVTPNPCTSCNGRVRFGAMLALAEALGAERLATGHYARIADDGRGPLLERAADDHKDQAYMLARLRPEQLERLSFPLGALTKPEVREIAREAGLPVADRRESQDLCFLAGRRREEFLARRGAKPAGPGPIVDRRGRVLGEHAGHERFTVGQRKGIKLAAEEPLFVLHKDPEANVVMVGPRSALATDRVRLDPIALERPENEVDRVKLRYRSAPVACRVRGDVVELEDTVDGAAPGQLACLMNGSRVLGWGTVAG